MKLALTILSLFAFSLNVQIAQADTRLLVKSRQPVMGAKRLDSLPSWQLLIVSDSKKDFTLKALQADPKVEWVEEDQKYTVEGSAENTFNDPLYSDQWSLESTGVPEAQALVPADAAPVLVAVIDTGIDLTHPDLKDHVYTNLKEKAGNDLDDDQNGFVDDVHGFNFEEKSGDTADDFNHGSHVSGTIGAIQNNHIGIAGIAPKVTILPVKWMKTGSGWGADAIEAIHYAVKMGARVINASWGGIGYSKALEDAVREAENAGVLFVASAGNKHSDNDVTPRHPANLRYSNVISVADLDEKSALSATSNYGKVQVELGAPGANILSAMMNGQYTRMSGTSMAAAHVSGVAALLLAINPKLTGQEIKKILMDTVTPRASLQGKTITGGEVNALAAAKRALEMRDHPSVPFHEFGTSQREIKYSGDIIHADHVEEGGTVDGMSFQFVRMVDGKETPVKGLSFKLQARADGTYQTYTSDESGFVIDKICNKSSFTVGVPLESKRYRVTNGEGSYTWTFPAKCGVKQKFIFDEKTQNAEPIAIWQIATNAEKKLNDEIGLQFWTRPVDFKWPAKGDFYDGDSVNLTFGYQWDVVSHEMGHAIYDRGHLGVFGGGEHYIDRCNSDALSISEGWASFYAAWLNESLSDPDPHFQYMVPRRAPIQIENIPADVCGKTTNEWRVTGFLWDLVDQHDDGESLSIPFSKLWNETLGARVASTKVLYDRLIEKGEDKAQLNAIWKLNFTDER